MTTDDPERGAGGEETARLATPRARAPWERKDPGGDDEVKHSALVGFMSVPVSRRFPVRRSTFLMAVAFVGLATLLYFYPAQSSNAGSGVIIHTPQGDVFVPGGTPVSTTTTTTTVPPTTTTTAPPPTTTQGRSVSTTSTPTTTTLAGGGGGGGSGTSGSSTTTTTVGSSGSSGVSGTGIGGSGTTSTTR